MSNEELERIQAKAEADPCFTAAEKRVLRELIANHREHAELLRVYRGWRFIGKVLRGFTVAVGIIAGAAAAIIKLFNGGS